MYTRPFLYILKRIRDNFRASCSMTTWLSQAEHWLIGLGCHFDSSASCIGKMFLSLPSLAPVNLVPRIKLGRPVPRQPNLVLTHGVPPTFRDGRCPFILPSTGIAPVLGLSRHKYVYLRIDGVHLFSLVVRAFCYMSFWTLGGGQGGGRGGALPNFLLYCILYIIT